MCCPSQGAADSGSSPHLTSQTPGSAGAICAAAWSTHLPAAGAKPWLRRISGAALRAGLKLSQGSTMARLTGNPQMYLEARETPWQGRNLFIGDGGNWLHLCRPAGALPWLFQGQEGASGEARAAATRERACPAPAPLVSRCWCPQGAPPPPGHSLQAPQQSPSGTSWSSEPGTSLPSFSGWHPQQCYRQRKRKPAGCW